MPLVLLLAGCGETMSNAEIAAAFEEVAHASAFRLVEAPVTITTDFTLGEGLTAAAEALADALRSQLPCSTVTVDGASVTLDLGTLDDACTWGGRTFAGVVEVEVRRADAASVEVAHTWTGLTDGEVRVDGGAVVTWTADEPARHVVYDVAWTELDTGDERVGTGELTQRGLDADGQATTGITIDGRRDWDAPSGAWSLDVEGVEWRWVDPVPEAGIYRATNPDGREAEVTFARVDDTTVAVTIRSGWRSRTFEVAAAQ